MNNEQQNGNTQLNTDRNAFNQKVVEIIYVRVKLKKYNGLIDVDGEMFRR